MLSRNQRKRGLRQKYLGDQFKEYSQKHYLEEVSSTLEGVFSPGSQT